METAKVNKFKMFEVLYFAQKFSELIDMFSFYPSKNVQQFQAI